jgi:hypothetical protein
MFQLDSGIYSQARAQGLSEKLGGQQIASSQQEMQVNDEKLKTAKIERAVQYLGMATPENWAGIRQQAIAEGLGREDTIPVAFDAEWIQQTRTAFDDAKAQLPTSAIQNYKFSELLGSDPDPEKKKNFDEFAKSSKIMDAGGNIVQINPFTGQATPVIDKTLPPEKTPQAIQQAAGAKVTGEAGANAAMSLPDALATAENSLQIIDQMVGVKDGDKVIKPPHAGFQSAVGAKGFSSLFGAIDPVGGSDAANFKTLIDQLQGGAFLEAFKSLKGGGAITEVEGQKATQAILRMNRAQSEDEFMKAADEYRTIINNGITRAKAKAGVTPPDTVPGAPAGDGWGVEEVQ